MQMNKYLIKGSNHVSEMFNMYLFQNVYLPKYSKIPDLYLTRFVGPLSTLIGYQKNAFYILWSTIVTF